MAYGTLINVREMDRNTLMVFRCDFSLKKIRYATQSPLGCFWSDQHIVNFNVLML